MSTVRTQDYGTIYNSTPSGPRCRVAKCRPLFLTQNCRSPNMQTPSLPSKVHTRTSLGLDAEHEEDAHFDVEPRHLGRRPGHSLVPEESLYSSSPAVNESRRAFKRAFLSFSGDSSTSDARSFPPWLQRLGDVAAGGRPCLYGAFAACTAASDSPTAD